MMGESADNRQAVERVVQDRAAWVFAAARRRVKDAALAEDVTQAVFLLYWRRRPGEERPGKLAAWLYRAVRYCAANALRLRQIQQRHEREAAMQKKERIEGMGADWTEVEAELEGAMDRLSERDREVVLLRFYEQRPLAEVGKALGISEEAARMRVQRAVEKLRGILGRKGISGTTAGLSAVLAGNVVGQMPEGLVGRIVEAVGTGGGSTVAAGIAKGALKMMAVAKVKVAVVGLLVVAGTVTAVVAQQEKPSPASQPNVTAMALKPVIEGDVVHARTHGTPDAVGGPLDVDIWFVRSKGIATAGRYAAGPVFCQLDDGVNTWRYRVGGKIIGRSTSEKTVDGELKRIEGDLAKAAAGLVRDASGDRVIAGVNCRYYKMAKEDEQLRISEIWIDDVGRVRALSSSVSHENQVEISYDEPVPEGLFSTGWPRDAQVIDGDRYLAERYSLAKALLKKQAAGLVFAVHECVVDDRGCYYVLCSTRPAEGTDKELGMAKGCVGGVEARRGTAVAGGELEPSGYIPLDLGRLQNVYGWVQVRWYAFVPDPSAPERHGVLRFAARAFAANELETWRKGKGLPVTEEFVVELDGNLDGNTDVPTSAEDFARTFWIEGERLWPAVDGTLWMAKPSPNGNGILEPLRLGAVPQEEYLKNVRQRIDHVMNPQKSSPWQMR